MRVEQAVRLLPDVEAMAPIRGLLFAAARTDHQARWASAGPYLTVGKWTVDPADVRSLLPELLQRSGAHLGQLYDTYLEALAAEERGATAEAVAALVRAGRLEETAWPGALERAVAWYDLAIGVAERLGPRGPEIEALLALGQASVGLGRHAAGARAFQRALALAEAAFDVTSAINACVGLGDASKALGEFSGAQAWYTRGLRVAEAGVDPLPAGRLCHRLGELALRCGDLTHAGPKLARAQEFLESAADGPALSQVLTTRGELEAALGRPDEAAAAYREALAWARRDGRDPRLEINTRSHLAELHAEQRSYVEAEEELRRAERLAIENRLEAELALVYVDMGRLRDRQSDETGFVFFEQALQLCLGARGTRPLEARVRRDYGLFRARFGPLEEARAHLERARELFESLGQEPDLQGVKAELSRISA